jgi:uncharacterized protein (DUF58 family)
VAGASYGALLDALRGVQWPTRRAVAAGPPGAHHSRARGSSAEFTEYRPYRQGDDSRRVDWKLLARSDRAYVRLATDRAVLPTVVVVDASASMAFPRPSRAKWTQACSLAVGIAGVAQASGDPVGLVVARADGVRVLPARSRRGVVADVVRALDDATPGGGATLGAGLGAARGARRVVIVSDFLEDDEALLREARVRIAGGAEVHALHVVAGDELDPRFGDVTAVDPEAPAIARPLVAAVVPAYRARFDAWRDGLAAAWRSAGGTYTLVMAEEPPARAVRRLAAGAAARA